MQKPLRKLSELRLRLAREDGLTLIEMLAVVIIIALLSSIALPSFLGQTDKAKNSQAVSTLRNVITDIESLKVNEGEDWSKYEDSDQLVADLVDNHPEINFHSAISNTLYGDSAQIQPDDTEYGLIPSVGPNNVIVRFLDDDTIHIYAKSDSETYYCAELVADDFPVYSHGTYSYDPNEDTDPTVMRVSCDNDEVPEELYGW